MLMLIGNATGDYARYWRHTALGDLQLLDARYRAHSFARHNHNEYVLGLTEHGLDALTCNGHSHVAPAGSVLIINPGDVHDGHPGDEREWVYRAMYPSVAMLACVVDGTGEGCAPAPRFSNPVIHDDELFVELRAIHRLLHGKALALEAQSRLLLALTKLVARHADEAPTNAPRGGAPAAVRRALEFLDAYATEDVTLATLARVAGLSPFWFIRVFEKHVGLTPHAYLIGQRIKLAKNLLATGASLAQVALETGFADQSHFTRRFRSIVGTTPGRFARIAASARAAPA